VIPRQTSLIGGRAEDEPAGDASPASWNSAKTEATWTPEAKTPRPRCYRRWGHNEGDDPSFTQPEMYRRIEELRPLRKRYLEKLVNGGGLTLEEGEAFLKEFRERLDRIFDEIPRDEEASAPAKTSAPEPIPATSVDTAVDRERLDRVVEAITTAPEGFHLHPKLAKVVAREESASPATGSQTIHKDEQEQLIQTAPSA
jgi:2-oxoglutarate dehydrogenase complex dehydrogenase (E1) component-like enzyme